MNEYTKHLSEPWFTLVKLDIKKCEGRVNEGVFSEMKKGDKIVFWNKDLGFHRQCSKIITNVTYYRIFHDYLQKEGLQDCLPGIDAYNIGVSVYRKYYTVEDETKNGVVAIRF
jgi:ASC-1-like (ASCH) protein